MSVFTRYRKLKYVTRDVSLFIEEERVRNAGLACVVRKFPVLVKPVEVQAVGMLVISPGVKAAEEGVEPPAVLEKILFEKPVSSVGAAAEPAKLVDAVTAPKLGEWSNPKTARQESCLARGNTTG